VTGLLSSRRQTRRLLLLLLAVGALLRFVSLKWDEGHHLHPDERFISMVEEKLSMPDRLSDYFDSTRSSLDPYNRGYGSFVYGTLPVLLAKGVGKVLGKTGYDGTYLVGRVLSGLFDLLTAWIAYLLTRRAAPLLGRGAAFLAAGLLAFCPLAIQLSHFWAVDTFLTTFTALTLLGAVRHASGRSRLWEDAATGIALGLAVSCKVTGLGLFLPVGVAVLIRALAGPAAGRLRRLAAGASRFALLAVAAAVTVRVAFPHAFLGPGALSFRLDPRYVEDLKRLVALSSSVAGYPPALQWAGRTPLFPLYNFVFWGGGPFFGLAALAGLLWAPVAILRRKQWLLLPLILHAALLIAYHAGSLGKSLRYFYPVYPVLAVVAAVALATLARSPAGVRHRLPRSLGAAALAGTAVWGLAFSAIYMRPHTRVEASRWIYAHVTPPARFANESWDDGIPFSFPGYDNGAYAGPQLDLWGPDDRQKVELIVKTLEQADWIAVTSNRVYANITRLPSVFPMTTAYYRALFDGRLGFERAAEFTSYPSLGPLKIPDDRAEEQFTVYDHPRVLLFRKTKQFSPERVRASLLAAMPEAPPTIHEWEKQPRGRRHVGSSLLPPRRVDVEKATSGAGPSRETGSLLAAVLWYLAVLLVGVVAFPLAHALFPRLQDRGAGVARTLGLVLTTFLYVLLVQLGFLRNGRGAAVFALVLVGLFSAALFVWRRPLILRFVRERWRLLAGAEIAFAAGYLLFLGIRSLNPEIYWGEKPMDFSILNVLVRTRSLPPSDPWFAGASLGYYAFGQQMVAFLTLLTGLSTRYTFNLAIGLLGGLILQGAFTLLRNWGGTVRAGIAGAGLTVLVGNLAGLREWLVNHRPLDWNYFWATSRVVKDTINEYPFWSLVFADLHAHVLAIPLFLLFAACALHFIRIHANPPAGGLSRVASACALGFAAATQVLTNAWDAPLLLLLIGLVVLAAAAARGRVSLADGMRAAIDGVVAIAAALLVALPLWVKGGGAPGVGRNMDPAAAGVDIVTIFGIFFFLALLWWLAAAARRLSAEGQPAWTRRLILVSLAVLLIVLAFVSSEAFCAAGLLLFVAAWLRMAGEPEDRLAFAFIAAAFLLILFTQRFYVSDRMNTFFKLFQESWLLLALGTSALAFRSRERPAALGRWPLSARVAFFVLLGAGLFTSVTAARGAVGNHFAAYSGPSLDGLRYLEETRPGEFRAVLWMRRAIRGTPVLLEAQGPSYQDFSRISMLTGLPTVLGWEHHVRQRGNPPEEIDARREAVRQIYSSKTVAPAEALLRRYHVGYVYVGWLEQQTYPSEGLKKFDAEKALFEVAYENREAKVFRVVGGDSEDVIAPARESLPEPAPGQVADEKEEPPSIQETPEAGRAPFSGMREPRDGAVDGIGRLWVADFGKSRLRIFDSDGGYLGGWGGRAGGTFGFRELCGVAIRGDDVYIADTWNGRIQYFTLAGEWKGTASGLYGPRGVAIASDGKVWVTDTGNNQLIVYDRLLAQPRTLGKKGSGPGEFSGPVGIAAGPSGSIYVADVVNRRIQVWDSDGHFQSAFPFSGWAEWGEPHLEAGDDETLYVTDPSKNAVVHLDRDGSVLQRWTAGDEGRTFLRPMGIALDRKRAILYVINSGDNLVAKLKLPEVKTR
jgi:YYY domain-containing protein